MNLSSLSPRDRAIPDYREELFRELREDLLREWAREFPEFNAERVRQWRGE